MRLVEYWAMKEVLEEIPAMYARSGLTLDDVSDDDAREELKRLMDHWSRLRRRIRGCLPGRPRTTPTVGCGKNAGLGLKSGQVAVVFAPNGLLRLG
jgi:hypothetical protein